MPEEATVARVAVAKEELEEAAESELGETAVTRKRGLEDLREWIDQQGNDYGCVKNVNDEFLLRFLRARKTDAKAAANTLKNYLTVRTTNPAWFRNLDVREPRLHELLSSGYMFVLPERDRAGRRVVFSRAASLDASKFTSCDVMRTHLITYETLLLDEECQIKGLTYVFDEEGVNWSHVSMWTPADATKAFASTEGAVPLRHREMNFVNMPWTMSLVYQFAKALLSSKLRKRLHTHSSFDRLKEHVPEEILPREYGGQMPLDEMVARWKAVLEERRPQILKLESLKFGSW